MKRINPLLGGRMNRFELDLRIAKGLAANGKLPEALSLLEPHRVNAQPWLFETRSAEVHQAMDNFDGVIRCYEKGLNMAPNNGAIWSSLAQVYVEDNCDPVRARECLAKAKTQVRVGFAPMFDAFIEGVMAFEEGNSSTARENLERALKIQLQYRGLTYRTSMKAMMNAYLAMALARMRHTKEARHTAESATSFLTKAKRTVLINRMRGEIPGL